MFEKPLESWLQSSPGASRVVKTPNDEFVALFTSAERDSIRCAESVRTSGVDGIEHVNLSESGVVAHFSKSGLPLRIWFIGTPEQNQFELKYEWSDNAIPSLQRFARHLSTDGGNSFELDFELVVLKASRRLGDDTPSLSIPPKDLPFGTRLLDKRGPRSVVEFVGGKDGEVHNSLQHTARKLQKMGQQ